MSGRPGRKAAIAAATLATALAGPAGARASDDTIRAVISSNDALIAKDEARVLRAEARYVRTHDPKPVRRAIKRELKDLRTIRGKLRREDASTSDGARGKRLVVSGLGLVMRAYRHLDAVFASADPSAQQGKTRRALREARRGQKAVRRGLKLLS
jgi:hypothetical protein